MFIGCTYDDICPVVALLTYMAQRGQQEGPFFRFRDGFPLTKARFVTRFWAALEEAGVSCCDYSGVIVFGSGLPPRQQRQELRTPPFSCWDDGPAQLFSHTFEPKRNS